MTLPLMVFIDRWIEANTVLCKTETVIVETEIQEMGVALRKKEIQDAGEKLKYQQTDFRKWEEKVDNGM